MDDARSIPLDESVNRVEHLLKTGEPIMAYDAAAQALTHSPAHVRLRQLMGLALARSGATRRANRVMTDLLREGHDDGETLGILARTHKTLALESRDESDRRAQLRQSFAFYEKAYREARARNHADATSYNGINAATLALLTGDIQLARTLAADTRDVTLGFLCSRDEKSDAAYWPLATLGEASLILEDSAEAERWYRRAAAVGRGRYADLAATRRQAATILRFRHQDTSSLRDWLAIPPVVVFTGHMVDSPLRSVPRFPPSAVEAVSQQIATALDRLDARIGYGSAACGADILLMEAILARGGEAHVVLPFPADDFRRSSVAVNPEGDWERRFDRLLSRAASVHVACDTFTPDSPTSYEFASRLLLGMSRLRARLLDTDLQGMAIWDGREGDGPGGTAWMVQLCRERGVEIQVIDPMPGNPKPEVRGQRPEVSDPKPAPGTSPRLQQKIVALLFADAVGFSKLNETQLAAFTEKFLGAIARVIRSRPVQPRIKNTWGDGLFLVYDDAREAGLSALELCETLTTTDWAALGLPPDLSLRIALHAGPAYAVTDPVTGRENFIGSHVSRAARLEPVTPPGQVYATHAFAALIEADGGAKISCEYVGRTPLAKGYGTHAIYHVTKAP